MSTTPPKLREMFAEVRDELRLIGGKVDGLVERVTRVEAVMTTNNERVREEVKVLFGQLRALEARTQRIELDYVRSHDFKEHVAVNDEVSRRVNSVEKQIAKYIGIFTVISVLANAGVYWLVRVMSQ